MSINDATNVASAAAASSISSVKKVTKTLTNNIFTKTLHQLRRKCYKCYYAKSYDQLPNDDISELDPNLISYYSGPDNGILDISLVPMRKAPPKTQEQPNNQNLTPTNTTNTSTPNNTDPSESNTKEQTEPYTNKQQPTLSNQPQKPKIIDSTLNNTTNIKKHPSSNLNKSLINERNLINECWDSFARCGIVKWNMHHHRSYGIAISLYENNPITNTTVGDPIADVYAILTRKNSSLLILADGVNWGPRSRLAARCAVRAAMNYINRNLFFPIANNENTFISSTPSYNQKCVNTHDIFKVMMKSFDAAQEFILQKKGTMTTLCCSVVVKLKDSSQSLWAVCTLSIGDSTAYVFNKEKGVFELTYGARNLNDDRDMRNVGGALGHVYGNKPDVSNLNYSLMYVKDKDIVFLVSDGKNLYLN